MEAGKAVSKIGKIGSQIKGKIVDTVGNVERKIYKWHQKGMKQSDVQSCYEAPLMQSTTTALSQSNQPIPLSGESSLILSDNSNVQFNVVLPSGQPADASASLGTESRGANPGGKFVLQGNKDVQVCMTSAGAGAPSSSSSGGETIITGNRKTQMYSATGVTAEGTIGESQASVKVSDNSESQIMNLTQSANISSTDIEKNSDCQIMNVPQSGPSAAVTISDNNGSQIMNLPQPERRSAVTISDNNGSQIMNLPQSERRSSMELNKSANSHISNVPQQTTLGELHHFTLPRPFKSTSDIITLNCDFLDVALTKEDTVLMAISGRGLTEYSLNMEELHHWRPTKPLTSELEEVAAVATMSDGRAAAGLCNSQLVVVLRRTGRRNAAGDGWTESLRLPKLQSPPWRISVHADILAVALGRFDKVWSSWRQDRHVQLLRLSDKAQVNCLSHLYDVHSLTITDDLIITVSYGKVSTRSGRGVHVIDAQKFADSTELLWRYDAVADDEEIQGVCAASDVGLLYALVQLSNLSTSRIVIISLRDGSELLSHALGFRNPLLPVCLSLGADSTNESGSVTTVLCRDLKSLEWRIVTVQIGPLAAWNGSNSDFCDEVLKVHSD